MDLRRIAILLSIAAFILVAGFRFGGSGREENKGSSRDGGQETPAVEAPLGTVSLSGKSIERPSTEDPEGQVQQMLADLKTSLPGLTEFPEQTLDERILAANAHLKKAGISLRFGVDEELYPSQGMLGMKVPAFSQENATPNDILQNAHKALNRHYMLSNGTVLFQDGSGG